MEISRDSSFATWTMKLSHLLWAEFPPLSPGIRWSPHPQNVTVLNRKGWLSWKKESMGVGYTPSWLVSLWEGRIWTYRQTSGYMCVGERPCEGSGRKCHGEKPRRNQTCQHIHFGLLASRTVRKHFFFVCLNYLLWSYGSPRKLIYYLLLLLVRVGYSNPTKMLTSPGP